MTRGGMCLKVNETYTSQVCSCCAWCQRVGRKVSQDSETGLGNRTWKQDLETGRGICGTVHHRDVNAARKHLPSRAGDVCRRSPCLKMPASSGIQAGEAATTSTVCAWLASHQPQVCLIEVEILTRLTVRLVNSET
jgi:hypothetical protein